MMRRAFRICAVASLTLIAACDDRDEVARLRVQASGIVTVHEEAIRARKEKEAMAADLERVRRDLVLALTAEATAEDQLAQAREEKASLAAQLSRALETAQTSAKTAQIFEAASGDQQVRLQKAAALEAEAARLRADGESLRRKNEALETRLRSLETSLVAKDLEIAGFRDRITALERQVREAPATPDLPAVRFPPGKKETIAPGLVLPVAFPARKGEVLRWVWAIVEAPADLADGAIEFYVAGPDGVRATASRAGKEKRGDDSGLRVTTDGTWTVVWANRHPTAPVTIQYAVVVVPARP
jgi:hypothetical protein